MNDTNFIVVVPRPSGFADEEVQKIVRYEAGGQEVCVLIKDKLYLRAFETGVPWERLLTEFNLAKIGNDGTAYVELSDVIRWYVKLVGKGGGTPEDLDFLADLKKVQDTMRVEFDLV